MHGCEKSDNPVVPKKPPNKGKGRPGPAEEVEGSGLAEGNLPLQTRPRAQDREGLQRAQERIREAARRDRKLQFTTLWHHVYDVGRLREG
jgi:hypothetical protein